MGSQLRLCKRVGQPGRWRAHGQGRSAGALQRQLFLTVAVRLVPLKIASPCQAPSRINANLTDKLQSPLLESESPNLASSNVAQRWYLVVEFDSSELGEQSRLHYASMI